MVFLNNEFNFYPPKYPNNTQQQIYFPIEPPTDPQMDSPIDP